VNFMMTPIKMLLMIHVVVFGLKENRLHVLLEQQQGEWLLPGEELGVDEAMEETADRQIRRLTGVEESYLEQLYTYGDPQRVPGQRCISVVYFGMIPADTLNDEGAEPCHQKWFPVTDLPQLGYDHGEIVTYALRRLRYKLEYSAVGFELLPELFTLTELQKMYEIVLGEKLDKRNFRRRILEANIIEATPYSRMGEGRPARQYRYRADAVAEVKTRRLFP